MPMKKMLIVMILFTCSCIHRGPIESEQEAIQVAEKELLKIYGDKILNQKPFHAKLELGIWKVTGTVNCPGSETGNLCAGGTGEVDINKETGEIVRITHTK